MSASQSHHQSVSFLFTVNQSRRHAILWRQMPWDHRLMSMCLHLQSWNECKIRLSARTTAANYTTDHLRFRNLELLKKKNKSKFRGFTWPKNGPFSVKLKGKWHYNCKGSDSSCLWRSAMMLWNVRGWVPWKYLTDVRKLLTFAAFFLVATYSQWVITTLGTFSVVVNPICAEQNISVSTRTIVKHATDSRLGRKVCDGQYVGGAKG